MTIKVLLAGILATSVLAGCATNKQGVNETAYRNNRDITAPTRVNYPLTNDNNLFDNRDMRNTDLTPVRNNTNFNDGSRMRVADEAADKIVALPEVDKANVIVTGNNAYVAARLVNNTNGLSRDIERKISDQVKSVDRDINDVYVSVNPDFYNRMTNYSNDIRSGHPIGGMFDEFTNTVRRVFPTHFNK